VARIIDPAEEFDDGSQLDLSELFCPMCGCNDVVIVSYPRGNAPRRTADGKWTGRWFGATGKAACQYCNIQFSIYFDGEED
jgi:hypothetical protein